MVATVMTLLNLSLAAGWFVAGIHVIMCRSGNVGGRDTPGHDGGIAHLIIAPRQENRLNNRPGSRFLTAQ
jgi:hypothetical protein